MPNTIISLENVNGRWVGEIEVGAPVSRRQVIRAESFDEGMAQIRSAYEGYLETFGNRPIFSGSGAAAATPLPLQPAANELPDPEAFVSEVSAAVETVTLDPVNESPKLPRGRHKATCNCPRCEAKKAERAAVAA